jgi:hypothetical protein
MTQQTETAETDTQRWARELADAFRERDTLHAERERLNAAAPALRDALRALVKVADEYEVVGFDNTAIHEIKRLGKIARAALASAEPRGEGKG